MPVSGSRSAFVAGRGFMSKALFQLFNDGPGNLKSRIISLYTVLIAANVAAWAWALIAFHDYPVLLGTCFLAYSFGLRHAVDADHIAAIDNVTRKLMQEGKRPIAVGLVLLARPFDRGGAGRPSPSPRRQRLQGRAGRLSRASAGSSAPRSRRLPAHHRARSTSSSCVNVYRDLPARASAASRYVAEDLDCCWPSAASSRASSGGCSA